jgi:hypothetical protein
MRLTTDRRRRVALLAVAIFALVGCKDRGGSGTRSEGTGTDSMAGGLSTPAVRSARETADSILKDLGDGKLAPDRLTTSFKKKLAAPGKDADQFAKEWLGQYKGATFVIGEEAKVGDATTVRGLAKFPDKAMAFALRLAKEPNGFKVAWLHRSERQGSEIKTPSDSELAVAQDTVRNFLDILLGGDLRQAHALMAPAWKKSLSPPGPADIRDGYDFGPGFLVSKTRAWKGDFLGYTLKAGDFGPKKDTASFTATMDSGSTKTPFTVKATKDPATGEWFVTDFEKQ